MSKSVWLVSSVMAVSALAITACGKSSSGAGGSTSTSGSTTAAATSTTSGGGVNGCVAAMATDDTGMAAVTINFGGTTGLAYSPNCIKVKAGTVVTFAGPFATHPLVGGTVVNGVLTPAAAGSTPLPTTPLSTGMSSMFTMSTAGTFGYYCNVHGPTGMDGAIIVQ